MAGVFKMVKGKNDEILQDIANQIDELSQRSDERKEQPIKKEVVLFFSFIRSVIGVKQEKERSGK